MRIAVSILLLSLLGACGDTPPIQVAGNYQIAVTNRENGCSFQNWTQGNAATGIPLTITQSGPALTATVGGLTGGWLDLVLGSKTFTGTVSGNHLSMTLYGTRSAKQAGCAYTVTATVEASLTGDVLVGTTDYTAATNGSPDCGGLQGCHSRQDFNGTRPPQ